MKHQCDGLTAKGERCRNRGIWLYADALGGDMHLCHAHHRQMLNQRLRIRSDYIEGTGT